MNGIYDVVCPDCGKHRTLTGWPRAERCHPCSAKARAVPVLDRLVAGTIYADSGCWEWELHRDRNGYGRINYGGQAALAYRVSYELRVGPVPDGLQLDHLCRNRACINPDHLEPVTAQVNQHRGHSPAGINHRKTECIHGHAFTPENTRVRRNRRECITCARSRVTRTKVAA